MLKYFIENEQGEWLAHPEEAVAHCWTRDPYKAWAFDREELTIKASKTPEGFMWRMTDPVNPGVLHFLQEEGIGQGYNITEHEYQEHGESRTWKHQITEDRKHLYPGKAEYYLTMYIKGVCLTDNSAVNSLRI